MGPPPGKIRDSTSWQRGCPRIREPAGVHLCQETVSFRSPTEVTEFTEDFLAVYQAFNACPRASAKLGGDR